MTSRKRYPTGYHVGHCIPPGRYSKLIIRIGLGKLWASIDALSHFLYTITRIYVLRLTHGLIYDRPC